MHSFFSRALTTFWVVVALSLGSVAWAKPALEKDSSDIFRDDFGEMVGTTLVLVGAGGDLAQRKLIPSLFSLYKAGKLPVRFTLVAIGRNAKQRRHFAAALQGIGETIDAKDRQEWDEFRRTIVATDVNFGKAQSVHGLAAQLRKLNSGPEHRTLFYLATPPSAYQPIVAALRTARLLGEAAPRSKVALEKPFGQDLASAERLQGYLESNLPAGQVLLIDHYLGKTGVLGLLEMRLNHGLFEPMWNRKFIESVHISAHESVGIERRASFYEQTGASRDFLQNHMMQLLSIVAMDTPTEATLREKKLQALSHLKPLRRRTMGPKVVTGQYQGYRGEPGVAQDSQVETYVKAVTTMQNDRWSGVPFTLETGKAMAEKKGIIRVAFRALLPSVAEQLGVSANEPAVLEIEIDPKPRITLVSGKARIDVHNRAEDMEAYQRILLRTMSHDPRLAVSPREAIAAWKYVGPILRKNARSKKIAVYPRLSTSVGRAGR